MLLRHVLYFGRIKEGIERPERCDASWRHREAGP